MFLRSLFKFNIWFFLILFLILLTVFLVLLFTVILKTKSSSPSKRAGNFCVNILEQSVDCNSNCDPSNMLGSCPTGSICIPMTTDNSVC